MKEGGVHQNNIPNDQGRRLLVVDDEQDICALVWAIVINSGFSTIVAHDLAQAREKVEATSFDAVLLDVHLPDGSGYDLIPRIKERSPKAKVIMISAIDREDGSAHQRGADLFIAKPFERTTILDALDIPASDIS